MKTLAVLLSILGFAVCQFNMECKINVRFRNDGHQKIRIDLLVPSLSIMSDPVVLTEWKQEKNVQIKGRNCEKKHWVFMVYAWINDDWVLKKKSQAKITGKGWFLTTVDEDYSINILDRNGIMCSEGNCGK